MTNHTMTRRDRQVRALKLLCGALYGALLLIVALAYPSVLFIPVLLLVAALMAGIVYRVQVWRKRPRYRRHG